MTTMNVWMPLMVGLKPDAAGAWAVSMGYSMAAILIMGFRAGLVDNSRNNSW